jgi:hypothetical protein
MQTQKVVRATTAGASGVATSHAVFLAAGCRDSDRLAYKGRPAARPATPPKAPAPPPKQSPVPKPGAPKPVKPKPSEPPKEG